MRIVPALDRGLKILDYIAKQSHPIRVAHIVAALDIPRSAVYELLNTLQHHKMILQKANGDLSLGPATMWLGGAYQSKIDFDGIASDIARDLMQKTNETVQVGRLDGRFVFYIAKAESSQRVRLVSTIGTRLPAHCTALGKMLLAYIPQDEFKNLFTGITLEALTQRSVTDLNILQRQLITVKNEDFSFEAGESNADIYCIAAPIHNTNGDVVAAMSISIPISRASENYLLSLQDSIRKSSAEFSQQLGFQTSNQTSIG